MTNGTFSLQEKNLLLVNTGPQELRYVLQRLKKIGVGVVALNGEKNWAQPYIDHWILADTYNHSESIESIRAFMAGNPNVRIDGAVTFWEDDIPLLAKICSEFKFTGNPYETAINTRDKFRMQDTLRTCGLPCIRQHLLKTKTDLETAMEVIGFPAVIKPVSGSDSQFVIFVNDEQEAQDAYQYLLKSCTPEYDPIYKYNRRIFLFQEFIEGHEFSMECYCQHGVPHVVGIHEKTAMNLPFFMETGDYSPPRISDDHVQILTEATKAALIVLGVRDSLAHVELKLTRDGPRVIEIASRMGGDYTHDNVMHVYALDMIRAGCEIALGINVTEIPSPPKMYVIGKFFIPETSGIITKIRGVEDVKKHRNLLSYDFAKKVGDSVLIPPDGYESIGWVTVKGNSYAEAERSLDNFLRKVRIEVSPFKSYSSVGKTLRKNRFSAALIHKKGAISIAKFEKLKNISKKDLRKLHVGIACNVYDDDNGVPLVEKDLTSIGRNIEKTLKKRGYKVTFFDFNDLPRAFNELKDSDVDIVFNVCERINNSSLLEPHAAAMMDALQIPYTGSNPFTLGLCIDKIRVKTLLNYYNISTPQWDYAYSLEDDIRTDLHYPLIVKPANSDNSIGITNNSVVSNKKELLAQVKYVVEKIGSPALIEEYIEGDEYDISIIGNDEHDLQVLPLHRSIFKNMKPGQWHIYTYEMKWQKNPERMGVILQQPPKNIGRKLESLLTEIALDTYNILDCHDYGRVEIRVDEEGNPYVLELNPNPSINFEDCVPYSAELVGMDYGDFIEEILRMAIRRYKDQPAYHHLQTNLF